MRVEIRIESTVCSDDLGQDLNMVSQKEYCRNGKSRWDEKDRGTHVDERERTWCLPLLRPNIYP